MVPVIWYMARLCIFFCLHIGLLWHTIKNATKHIGKNITTSPLGPASRRYMDLLWGDDWQNMLDGFHEGGCPGNRASHLAVWETDPPPQTFGTVDVAQHWTDEPSGNELCPKGARHWFGVGDVEGSGREHSCTTKITQNYELGFLSFIPNKSYMHCKKTNMRFRYIFSICIKVPMKYLFPSLCKN